VAYEDVALICEIDEQWSYVGNKKNRHWLWYAFDTKRKQVIAHVFGPRTDETCRRQLALLQPFTLGFITTDDWGVTNVKFRQKYILWARSLLFAFGRAA
jgi:insertion element IS1 protein InsB